MSDVFNTAFEISLRVLLTLEVANEKRLSTDMIAAADFITVYSRDFGLSTENLHGNNSYRFGEFALRRELAKEALKTLVQDGFVYADATKAGFTYHLNERGQEYAAKFNTKYATHYLEFARRTHDYLLGMSEREALRQINQRSVISLRGGDSDG